MYNQKQQIFFLLDSHTYFGPQSQLRTSYEKKKGLSLLNLPEITVVSPKQNITKTELSHQQNSTIKDKSISRLYITRPQIQSQAQSPNHSIHTPNYLSLSPSTTKATKFKGHVKKKPLCSNYIQILGMIKNKNHHQQQSYQMGMKDLGKELQNDLIKKVKVQQPKMDQEYKEFKESQSERKRQSLAGDEIVNSYHAIPTLFPTSKSHLQSPNHSPLQSPLQSQIKIGTSNLIAAKRNKGSQQFDQWTIWYQLKHRDQINQLKGSILTLLERLFELQTIWKNAKRVLKLIKTILKPELALLMFENEQYHNGMSTNQLIKQFQYKETIFTPERNIMITKYNFNYLRDLSIFSDLLGDIIHDAKIVQLTTMKDNILNQLIEVKQIEHKIMNEKVSQLPINRFKETQLSYFDPSMNDQTRDHMLERAERLYGSFQNPTTQNREINSHLKTLLQSLKSS